MCEAEAVWCSQLWSCMIIHNRCQASVHLIRWLRLLSAHLVLSRCDVGLCWRQRHLLNAMRNKSNGKSWQGARISCQSIAVLLSLTGLKCACHFLGGWERRGGEGAFGLEHAVLFFRQYLDPKSLRNQITFHWTTNQKKQIFLPFSWARLEIS